MQTVLLSLALLMLHGGHGNYECATLHWTGVDRSYDSENAVVIDLVRQMRERNGIEMDIMVCGSRAGSDAETVPMPAAQHHRDTEGIVRGFLHIPDTVPLEFSPAALRGMIAHELAHLVLPQSVDCQWMPLRLDPITNEERVACETPADALAAEWTSTEDVIATLHALETLLRPYAVNEEGRKGLQQRVELRIKALQK